MIKTLLILLTLTLLCVLIAEEWQYAYQPQVDGQPEVENYIRVSLDACNDGGLVVQANATTWDSNVSSPP
ncbi:MAG: hypothetical protein K8S56_04435 [Candidatus Cloacimonetes bacterium]|nr:hypothetical protein [Candidatus Cloacimonadota bacterium]